jgi:hypothetical protein
MTSNKFVDYDQLDEPEVKQIKMRTDNIKQVPYIFTELHCHSIDTYRKLHELSKSRKFHYEQSDKIILPTSFIKLFEINEKGSYISLKLEKNGKIIFCGLGEMLAEEHMMYAPQWVIEALDITSGDKVNVTSVSLDKATKIKTKIPKSFVNSKPILEFAFRNHVVLYLGKKVTIKMFDKTFDIIITELEPKHAVSIIDCEPNLDVEFS